MHFGKTCTKECTRRPLVGEHKRSFIGSIRKNLDLVWGFLLIYSALNLMNDIKGKGEVVMGTVEEALPNTLFRVSIDGGDLILAYLAGKMRKFRIKVLIGDKVQVLLDPYGGKGRIIKRL